MLPKKNKLNREAFDGVWKEGGRIHSPLFTFIYKKSADVGHYSAVISKKVAKTAVLRNRLRRLIYKTIDFVGGRGKPISGVFILKPEAKTTSLENLSENISKTIKNL